LPSQEKIASQRNLSLLLNICCFLWKTMDKIPEVETAKELMTEAMTWSVMKWLREKKRVRKTADQANAALDRSSQAVREQWPESARMVYETLAAQGNGAPATRRQPKGSPTTDPSTMLIANQSKEKDDESYRARMDAEDTFDLAEKQLSTSLAREGCRKAIYSWELHEKAIRKAETLIRK
jgi:hypothetical protein